MNIEERTRKIKALLELLEYSLLFPLPLKTKVAENVDKLSDDQVITLGKILAIEHYKRGELDEKMRKTVEEELARIGTD